MNIPKYWAKSVGTASGNQQTYRLTIWQWSDLSREDAQRKADARVNELVQKAQAGADLQRYPYGQRPLREEIIQVIADSAGRQVGVMTRNTYGAQVLNAANAMFIDIDFPEKDTAAGVSGFFQRLRGTPVASQDERQA